MRIPRLGYAQAAWSKSLTTEGQPTELLYITPVLSHRYGSLDALIPVFNTSLCTWGEKAFSVLL